MSRDRRTGGPTPAPINEAAMAGYGAPCRPVTSERRTGSHPVPTFIPSRTRVRCGARTPVPAAKAERPPSVPRSDLRQSTRQWARSAVSGHFQDLDRSGGMRRTDRSAYALRALQKRLDGPTTVLADCRSAHAQQSGGPMEKCGWRRVIAYYDLGSFCSVAANLTTPLSADGHCCFLQSWPLASPHRRSGAITLVG
jgi:hypothetical protein